MKYLKSFNESGIADNLISELSSKIKEFITIFYPNIKDADGNIRNFLPVISANQSKYGKQIEVTFTLGQRQLYGVKYSDVNSDFKQLNFLYEIMDIIKEVEGSNKVTLIGFYYFGNKVMGAKDGKLKTIEDVSDKFDKALDELDANPDVEERIISFWFNIK